MKKVCKNFLLIIMFVSLLFINFYKVNAAPQSITTGTTNGTYGNYKYPKGDDKSTDTDGSGRLIGYEVDSNGNRLYCLDYNYIYTNNSVHTYVDTQTNVGMACALIDIWYNNGTYTNYEEPSKTFNFGSMTSIGLETNLSDLQYVIIQEALWDHVADKTPADCSNHLNKYKTLPTGEITIKLDNQLLSLTEDEKYYVSDKISITTKNLVDATTKASAEKPKYIIYAVNAPVGYYFSTTPGGEKLETLNNNFVTNSDSVYLNIPVAEESYNISEIKVVAKGVYNSKETTSATASVHRYRYSTSQQDVGFVEFNTKTTTSQGEVQKEVKVYFDAKKVTISKKDIANEDELEGAHIIVYNESGEIVDEFDSTKESHEIYLPAGKYTLKETVSPDGYQQIDTIFEFKVSSTGKVTLLSTESDYFKASGSEITLYNKLYDVPDTGKTRAIIYLTIGSILIVSGGLLIYLILKKRNLANM